MNRIKALQLLVQFCLSQWTSKDILTQSIHAPSSQRLKKPITRGRGGGVLKLLKLFFIQGRAFFHFYNFLSPIRPKDGLCDKHVHVLPIRWKCDLVTVHLFITNRPVRELQNMFCMLTSVVQDELYIYRRSSENSLSWTCIYNSSYGVKCQPCRIVQ